MPTSSAVSSRLRELRREDREPLARIITATGAFTEEEVAVALELIDAGIQSEEESGYHFVIAEELDRVVGYACFGPTPLTDGTYDLYWIVVDRTLQSRGVGRALLTAVDERVRARLGRMVLIETAGKTEYAAQRAFYERSGCELVARIPDFYRVGDDKLVYARRLQ